jgi:thiosulfate dehydrogenase (quinone) large subunit
VGLDLGDPPAVPGVGVARHRAREAARSREKAGAAITGFVTEALKKTGGPHPDVQWWYAGFLEHAVLPHPVFWSYVVSGGEVLVGVALILGVLTGIAAFFGSVMNVSYLLAGTVSINPILFAIATWLVLAWKTAGWWGLDRWVLPALGTPWSPGLLFQENGTRKASAPSR